MRRTKLVLAAAAVMVALLVAFAAPAMAKGGNNHNGNDTKLDKQDVKLDNRILNDNNNNFRFDDNNNFRSFDDGIFFSPFAFENESSFFSPFAFENESGFNSSCPFAGDTEGIVNEFDCFDNNGFNNGLFFGENDFNDNNRFFFDE
jgi:hypothetical protein